MLGAARAVFLGAGPSDPSFDSVSLLLHCDGTDGSTTFTDNSNTGHTVTAVADAQIDTAAYKFGGASGLFDGINDLLDAPASAEFNIGTGNFTLEGWVKTATAALVGGYSVRLFKTDGPTASGTSGTLQVFLNSAGGVLRIYDASGIDSSGSTDLTDDVWHHWAFSRVGTALKGFVDGDQEISITSSLNITANSATPRPRLCGNAAGQGTFTGHIDDFRLTNGVGRYTGAFTAPTSAFPNN
jgi:hypothetical protein